MQIGTTGLVTNEYNEILLILRDDTHTWCAPGGSLDAGELPTDGTAREVQEETGMYTLPIRLVAADFWPTPAGTLHFTFRCLIRGGEPTPSPESPQVGFHKYNDLPQPMLALHKDRLLATRDHVGPAVWSNQKIPWQLLPLRLWLMFVVYPLKNLRTRWRKEPAYQPPQSWEVDVLVAIPDSSGTLLTTENKLPHGRCIGKTPPWDVAQKLVGKNSLTEIAGIYVHPNTAKLTMVFSNTPAYNASIPATLTAEHRALIDDIRLDPDVTRIAFWPTS